MKSATKSHGLVASVAAASFLVLALQLLGDDALIAARLLALPLGVGLLGTRTHRLGALAFGPGVLSILLVIVGATGGLSGSAYVPLVYLWMAILAGLARWQGALLTAAALLVFEIVTSLEGALPLTTLLAHVGFTAVFASLYAVLLIKEVRTVRTAKAEAVREVLARVEDEARDFRLIGSLLGPESGAHRDPESTANVRKLGSVRAIRDALIDVLEVARISAAADTALLFVLNEAGAKLKLAECVSSVGEPPLEVGHTVGLEGALGAVVRTKRPVNLQPRSGGRGLGYETQAEVGSFLGVPVLQGEHVAAVLVVERKAYDTFTDRDEQILAAVAREVARAIESERIFASMDRNKYEQERFYEAFSLLNQGISIDGFAGQFLEAVSRIKATDFAAVTLYETERGEHRVVGLRADDAVKKRLEGYVFADKDGGLVAMALKNGHALPYVPLSEQPDRAPLQLFGNFEGPNLESVKVIPLHHRGVPLGALVIGSGQSGKELSREEQRMLDTVSAHAANTLANARMYQRMEMMATTDGLTGLYNHRRFQELLSECLARAARFGRQVSVLMVDADHFKSVNDTYGHPVGDLVLKRIASLLMAEARRTDVVARYGGEEFVVILDETDAPGAQRVAERIRARIEAEQIQGDFGRVKVTASLGICSWPLQAKTQEELLERSDDALYEAKRKGRNRVTLWRERGAASEPPRAQA